MFGNLNIATIKAFGEPVTRQGGGFSAIVDFPTEEGHLNRRDKDYALPKLGITETVAKTLKKGDKLTVRGTEYIFVKAVPDGGGMATAYLNESGTGDSWYDDES
jgi:hypothetical protein